MADWEEIKRLAADFQRTQTIETLNRISERHCIDVIKKLVELNYIDIIYSCDGKEIVTPEQLLREIEDEVYKNGGRIQLHELAAKLNVDYQHVENKANQLVKSNSEYNLILGQLIHSVYKEALAKRINHSLLVEGELSMSEFSKSLDLPSDYLLSLLKDVLASISNEVVLSQDGQTVYTAETMDKYRSIITGTLTAILKPTSIASLMKRLDIPEKIFVPIVEKLIKEGRISASLENRQFIPSSFVRQQNEYINRFYLSNSYIEYDVITRMDIKQPKPFLKKRFPDGIQLKTCLISPLLITQVESILDETNATNSWIDVSTILPSSMDNKDIEEILAIVLKKSKQLQSSCLVFDGTYVCSRGYVETCKRLFEGLMEEKADQDLKSGKLIAHFMIKPTKPKSSQKDQQVEESAKDDKRNKHQPNDDEWSDDDEPGNRKGKGKKGQGSGGAASQGREVKSKNVKKKYFVSARGSNKKTNDTGVDIKKSGQSQTQTSPQILEEDLILQDTEEMIAVVQKQTSEDCSDKFLLSIVKMIEDDVNKKYAAIAKQTFDVYIKEQENQQQDKEKQNVIPEETKQEDIDKNKENDSQASLGDEILDDTNNPDDTKN